MTWQTLPFLDVFKDASGGNVKTPQKDFLESGEIPVVDQGQSLIAGYVNDRSRVCKTKQPVIIFGDHTRAIKYIDFEFAMGADGTKVLVPKLDSDTKYLFYALRAVNVPDAGYSRHYKFLKETVIPFPPLAEQKRIAAILDAADALRAKRRESLAQLDALVQSTFLEMFGDPVTNPKGWESVSGSDSSLGCIQDLANVADVIDCKHRTPLYTDEGYPVVRPRDVREDGIAFDNCVKTSREEFADLTEKRLPRVGDIVYSRNATFGVASLVTTSEKFAIGQDVCLIVPRNINSVYLFYLLNSHFVRRQLGLATSGSTFKRINLKAIRKLKILVAPETVQKRFEAFYVEQNQLRILMHRSEAELDALFASLQHRAFAGELSSEDAERVASVA